MADATAASSDVVLDVRDLEVAFETRGEPTRVVRGASFQVKRGEIMGLVGESGSGKSVTARALVGLVPHPGKVTGGSINFRGHDLRTSSEKELQKIRGARISLVLQEPMTSLNPVLSIYDQLREPLEAHPERGPKDGTSIRTFLIDLLGRVQIADAAQRIMRYPHHFSGGMRQRVCIAMGISTKPELLIADEPTTALDVTTQAQVLRLLLDLRDSFGVSMLLITHDLAIVSEVCDRVAVMYHGKIVEAGDVSRVFTNPRHPYTRALLGASTDTAGERRSLLPTIEGQPPPFDAILPGCPFAPRCTEAMDRCTLNFPPEVGNNDQRVSCWLEPEAAGIAEAAGAR